MMMRALPPMRISLHPDDHERYGSGSWVYDESALTRLPFRELRAIESALESVLGLSIEAMIVRMRRGCVDAKLAASWVARRQSGITEDLAGYEPLVGLMAWEPVGDDADPPAQESPTGSTSLRRTRASKSS